MGESAPLSGPDLTRGVDEQDLAEGRPLLGHASGEAVMLVRRGEAIYATAATCTHYSGPLAEGLVVGDTVRCPWHHACFDLKTGAALAPALTPIACYELVREGSLVRVGKKREIARPAAEGPSSVVIVGAGAAGAACAEALRRGGYRGPVTLLGDELPGPVDRPNLSKDYLAGNAPDEWIPLRDAGFYREQEIELTLGDPAAQIDTAARRVTLQSGRSLSYGALVLATGAAPRKLDIPGADGAHVHLLRTLADARAIIAQAKQGARAVVIGASFIGLEAAASLRTRGLSVDVVGQEAVPLGRVLGEKLGGFVRTLHEAKGVRFHLGRTPQRIEEHAVLLDDGRQLACDLVVVGVGVSLRTAVAQAAGLTIERGVVVDERLESSAQGVYAAGDIAAYPDPWSGARVRIEHWQVAERQGQFLARALLGQASAFRDVPFFWSAHYDVTLHYVGHAEAWDRIIERGELAQRKYAAAFARGDKILAAVCVGEDRLNLEIEAAMQAGDAPALMRLVTGAA